MFNKGITGCGATTLAIKQPGDTILAMPFIGLVQNKVASNPELLGIYGGVKGEDEIIKYIGSHRQKKIATTYDSFPFVCDVLISQGLDPYKDFFLFVDEWHQLFNSYKFRNQAAKHLLEYAANFERKTYVSATPVPREYWLKELQDLPEYILEWPSALKVNVNSNLVKDPLAYMARLCKSKLENGGDDNYHIFNNSVEGITKMVRLAGLLPEDCRIVCSQNTSRYSKKSNQEKLGEYRIQTTLDPVKPFNFYTSTCFEGQDIFDKNGRIFIVSEPHKDHTKVDIMTTLPQICGRIRDSKYNAEINQFYAESPYKDVSLEEYKESIKSQVEEAERDAVLLNQTSDNCKELLKGYINKAPFLDVVKDKIVVDENLANLEIVNYGIVNGQYAMQCNMNASLAEAGFNVTNDLEAYNPCKELKNLVSIEKTPFKEIFEEYASIRENNGLYNLNCFRRNQIEIEKPLVKEAYEVLGASKVREMKYHQSNIKREIIKREHETKDTKVFLMLDEMLPRQVSIPKSEIKEILTDIYKELGMTQKAKATDLKK